MGIILCAFGLGLVIQGICYCRGQGSFSSKWWITILLVVMSLFFGVFIPGDYYESEEPEVIKIAGIQRTGIAEFQIIESI